MRVLLDTHFLVWLATGEGKVSAVERDVLQDPDNRILVSVLSLWEIRIKWRTLNRKGKRKGTIGPEDASTFAVRNGFELAALEPDDVILSLDPALHHRDPFDEMLLVHAQRLGARLLTRDDHLVSHPLALSL